MNGENDQISSCSGATRRNCPAIIPASTFNGKLAHSPCNAAGSDMSAPPSPPDKRPPITPSSSAVSSDRSPARKLLTLHRIQTPSAMGIAIHNAR